MKNKLYIFILALMGVLTVEAQRDGKAKEILDQVSKTYRVSDGIRIDFKGTQRGSIWVKGEMFVLECGGVKSWFDGQTQWSYVADNEEVTVSSPTPEEIQTVNPYALVTMYQKGFDYHFLGLKMRNGKRGNEISLVPNVQQDIRMFLLSIGENNVPYYIGVDMTNGHYEEFIVTDFKKETLADDFFRFNEKLYPNTEVIDLR